MDTVSVIISNYNRADLLIRAVKSVLVQSHPVLEILVCDDGSTDDSKEKIKSLNEPKVKWIDCGRNGRPAIPRNHGIKNSKGNWLAFLDNDDEWFPSKIEKQLSSANKLNVKAVCTNANRVRVEEDTALFFTSKDAFYSFEQMLESNQVICSSMFFHKDLIRQISGFPEEEKFRAIEDYALWLRIAYLEKISFLSEPLLNYFDDAANSIRKEDVNHFTQRKLILNNLKIWTRNVKNDSPKLKLISDAINKNNVQRLKYNIKKLIS